MKDDQKDDLLAQVKRVNLDDPYWNPLLRVTQEEIDHVNELYAGMRRNSKQLLKDAMEIGDWFIEFRRRFDGEVNWTKWLERKCPKIRLWTAERFIRLASNREFVMTFAKGDSLESIPNVNEAIHLIAQQKRMDKQVKRVRAVVVRSDAPPEVMLEAKLKNYVISLYLLRYLQVEIEGMLEAMNLQPDQLMRVLRYVCKEHHEVEEEVMRMFGPKPKLVSVK